MTAGFSQSDLFYLYDEIVEDMLGDWDLTTLHPRDALDMSEIVEAVNAERKLRGQELVNLPPALHRQINQYAKLGMYKGKGRDFDRPDSELKRQFIDAWKERAKERKEALQKSGEFTFPDGTVATVKNKTEALDQAAIETAAAMRAHGLKRKSGTVKREMSGRR